MLNKLVMKGYWRIFQGIHIKSGVLGVREIRTPINFQATNKFKPKYLKEEKIRAKIFNDLGDVMGESKEGQAMDMREEKEIRNYLPSSSNKELISTGEHAENIPKTPKTFNLKKHLPQSSPVTEIELHSHLKSIVSEMPEEKIIRSIREKNIKEILSIIQNMGTLLTPTLVKTCHNLCKLHLEMRGEKNLILNGDWYLNLWQSLSREMEERADNLTNEDVVTVLQAFSRSNALDCQELFREMEEAIIESEMQYDLHQLFSILTSYKVMNYGTPALLADLSRVFIKYSKVTLRDGYLPLGYEPEISLQKMAEITVLLCEVKNSMEGGFGMVRALQDRIRLEIDNNKVSFSTMSKVANLLMKHNIGENKLFKDIEYFFIDKFEEVDKPGFLQLIKSLSTGKYRIQTEFFAIFLGEKCIDQYLDELTPKELSWVIQGLLLNPSFKLHEMGNTLNKLLDRVNQKALYLKPREIAKVAHSFSKCRNNLELSESTANNLQDLYKKLGRGALTHLSKFTVHDLLLLINSIKNIPELRSVAEKCIFHILSLASSKNNKLLFKYENYIELCKILEEFGDIKAYNMDKELWDQMESKYKEVLEIGEADDQLALHPDKLVTILYHCRRLNLGDINFVSYLKTRLSGHIQGISKYHFGRAFSCFVEYMHDITSGIRCFLHISHTLRGKLVPTLPTTNELILLLWSLSALYIKLPPNHQTLAQKIVDILFSREIIEFLNSEVDIGEIQSKDYYYFIQLLQLYPQIYTQENSTPIEGRTNINIEEPRTEYIYKKILNFEVHNSKFCKIIILKLNRFIKIYTS